MRVVDASGAQVHGNEMEGELCVRGPHVMLGYWDNVKQTADVLSEEGWFRTGDLGKHYQLLKTFKLTIKMYQKTKK